MRALCSCLTRRTIGRRSPLTTERSHRQKPSLIPVTATCARGEDGGIAHVAGPANTETSGARSEDATDKSQAGFPGSLHTYREPLNPKYRNAAHKPDKKDFSTTARNNNKLHHRLHLQWWVRADASEEGKKPPRSHPPKLHIEERKVPGFLQCVFLLGDLHPNSQSCFQCTWV